MRNPTVSRTQYLKILKEIRSLVEKAGATFKLYHRPIIWNGWGSGVPRWGVYGTFDGLRRTATVTSLGRNGRAEILFTAFHELRHAQHVASGLFSDYYDPKYRRMYLFLQGRARKPKKLQFMDEENARAAEQDCNDFAFNELNKRGIRVPNEVYPKDSTLAAQFNFNLRRLVGK